MEIQLKNDGRPDPERYLVAVSGSGNSEFLIRWTHAAARRGGGAWTALHVRSSDGDEADPESLERNLELARKLGGEVLSLPSDDIVKALLSYARIKNATALVIGKSGEGASRSRQSVMESILRESGDLDVILLRGDRGSGPRRRSYFQLPGRLPVRDAALAAASVFGVSLIGLLVHPYIGYRSVAILYLLGIIVLSMRGGRAALFMSAVLSAVSWNFLFVPPQFALSFEGFEDALLFGSFFVTALAVGYLTGVLRRNEEDLSVREERMALLYGLSRLLSKTRGVDAMATVAGNYVADCLDADVGLILRGPEGRLDFGRRFGAGRGSGYGPLPKVARACFEDNAAMRDEHGRHYLPLVAPDAILGVLVVGDLRVRERRGETKELLSALAGSIAVALEREILVAENESHRMAAESERLRRTLLNHVSHELRTPLTTIKGSASALLEASCAGAAGEDDAFRAELLAQTLSAADKLNALVEDLLSMSRLEAGALRLNKEQTDVLELLGSARESLAGELAGRRVYADASCVDAELEADPALMVQVFRNLLRNFAAYTPREASLRISASKDGDTLRVVFADDGPGVPEDELPSLFQTFYRGSNGASRPGCGLGLSICKGIIEAHAGSVGAETGVGGGFVVTVGLPIKESK